MDYEQMEDHDQRFKNLIREFFADFLRLFFSVWAARFDLERVEWLDKEVFPDPPKGKRRVVDMVAKLHAREPVVLADSAGSDDWLSLIHIEIEAADHTTDVKPRMPRYYWHLRDQHQLPVLPIVIYLKVGLDGIGVDVYVEKFWDLTVLSFSYLYVGLPALEAEEYVKGDNWLGVALSALMKIPKDRIVLLGAEAYRRIAESPLSEQKRFLLQECFEAYAPFDEEQRREYEQRKQNSPSEKVQAMNKTTYERGMEKGMEKGIKGMQNVLLKQGVKRFGAASADIESGIHAITEITRLEQLLDRVLEVESWAELLKHD